MPPVQPSASRRRARATPRRPAPRLSWLPLLPLLVVLAGPAGAMGLGEIAQQSALGAPLRIVVPVIAGPGEEITGECFRLGQSSKGGDGIPDVLNARVVLERVGSGARLVVTAPRRIDDPIVRVTVQAGCANPMRREYTLLLDPVPIDVPVAQDVAPRPDAGAQGAPAGGPAAIARAGGPTAAAAPGAADIPSPPPARTTPRRAAPAAARTTRAADGAAAPAAKAPRAAVPARTARKAAPAGPVAAAPEQPRLSVSAAPPTLTPIAKAAPEPPRVDADPARAPAATSQEAARSPTPSPAKADTAAEPFDPETVALRKRVEELTALVERMQQEMRATEALAAAQATRLAAENAARSTPQAAMQRWWNEGWPLLAAVIGLAALIAAGLTWKRSRGNADLPAWRAGPVPHTQPGRGSETQPQVATAAVAAAAAGPVASAPLAGPSTVAPPRLSEVDVSELSHVTEEAGVYLAFNRVDRAIEVLQEHIHAKPRSIPAAWLMLLDLYRTQGREEEFRKLADEFHRQFNAETPSWEAYPRQEQAERGLEAFPHLIERLVAVWATPECRPFLEHLLYENRDGRRNGFSLAAYEDILFLRQLAEFVEAAPAGAPAGSAAREPARTAPIASTPLAPASPAPAPAAAAAAQIATVPRSTPSAASIVRARRPVTLDLELALDNDMLEAARAQAGRDKQKRGA